MYVSDIPLQTDHKSIIQGPNGGTRALLRLLTKQSANHRRRRRRRLAVAAPPSSSRRSRHVCVNANGVDSPSSSAPSSPTIPSPSPAACRASTWYDTAEAAAPSSFGGDCSCGGCFITPAKNRPTTAAPPAASVVTVPRSIPNASSARRRRRRWTGACGRKPSSRRRWRFSGCGLVGGGIVGVKKAYVRKPSRSDACVPPRRRRAPHWARGGRGAAHSRGRRCCCHCCCLRRPWPRARRAGWTLAAVASSVRVGGRRFGCELRLHPHPRSHTQIQTTQSGKHTPRSYAGI